MKITYPSKALYHMLTHFNKIAKDDYNELINVGYTDDSIRQQLSKPGSKFYENFASSPREVVAILESKFPAVFSNATPDIDNKYRLSFEFDEPIGICNLIEEGNLTRQERQTITIIERNGCNVRTAKSDRIFPTNECQLVLEQQGDNSYVVCTLFPGMMAPPLPRKGESDPFWDSHIFIE